MQSLQQSLRQLVGKKFEIKAPLCKINGTAFSIKADGVIQPLGVYNLNAKFSGMPPDFHPLLSTTYLASICCAAGAVGMRGGRNLTSLGLTGYDSERTIEMKDGGKITITAEVALESDAIGVNASIQGNVRCPTDLTGLALYREVWWPTELGEFVTEGEGTMWRAEGTEEIPLTVNTRYSLKPKNPLPYGQRRTIVENGTLDGLNYRSKIHSFVEKLRV